MTKRDLHLDQIEIAGLRALEHIEGMTKDDFLADLKTQQAVILNLIVMGEAATRILTSEPGFAMRHPEIPWAAMRGMRNRIAHGYFDLDLGIVWDTVGVIPSLIDAIRAARS